MEEYLEIPVLEILTLYIVILLFQLSDISDDDYLSLMNDDGELRQDLKCPEGEVGVNIKKALNNDENPMVSLS